MLKHDTGVLSATTAFGKTVVAAWLIAQRGVNTLSAVPAPSG
jgi:superfamily II DNA or RNA helicase